MSCRTTIRGVLCVTPSGEVTNKYYYDTERDTFISRDYLRREFENGITQTESASFNEYLMNASGKNGTLETLSEAMRRIKMLDINFTDFVSCILDSPLTSPEGDELREILHGLYYGKVGSNDQHN